jgi:hypothetical protein
MVANSSCQRARTRHENAKSGHEGNRRSKQLGLLPSQKLHAGKRLKVLLRLRQRHCLAISSRIWAACCLDLSSRLLLLVSRLRRARSSSRLARWNSPLSAMCGGPWGGGVCRRSGSPVTTWGLDLQYSVLMLSTSRASIAWKEFKECFRVAQILVRLQQIMQTLKLAYSFHDIGVFQSFLFYFSRYKYIPESGQGQVKGFPHLYYCWGREPKHFKTINWSWRLYCRQVSSSHTELPSYFHIKPLADQAPALGRRDIDKNFTWGVF